MVNLLIVSHSAEIARGVKALADQMTHGRVHIMAAGGMPDGSLGASVDVIVQALEGALLTDGLLVLVDLGSAVMSAEMVLENSDIPFIISKAPLVEGTLVAAVEATRTHATLAQVAAAAERALEAKGLGTVAASPQKAASLGASSPVECIVRVRHASGLHMRPATLFVQMAARFRCAIKARNLDHPVSGDADAKSILDVMKLGVAQGHRVRLVAEGDDALTALDALQRLVERNFED